MKCKNCNKNMELKRYLDCQTYNPKSEKFIYECSNCGILANAKPNINFKEDYNKKSNAVLKDLQDFNLIVEKEALESLLWAKLKDDKDYFEELDKLKEQFNKTKENLKQRHPDILDWRLREFLNPYFRERAKNQFRAIMVFIDKKGLMPIGEEN